MLPRPNPQSGLLDGMSWRQTERAVRLLLAANQSLGDDGLTVVGTPPNEMPLLDIVRVLSHVTHWVYDDERQFAPDLAPEQQQGYDLARADVFALVVRTVLDPEFAPPGEG